MRLNLMNYSAAAFFMTAAILLTSVSVIAQESTADPAKAAADAQRSDPASVKSQTPGNAEATTEETKTEASDITASKSLAGLRNRPFAGQPDTAASINSLSPKAPKQSGTSSEWQMAFAPYLYMTGISGTIGARGRVIEVDSSFGNVLENLSFGLMGVMEAKKGRFIFTNDIMWTKMGVERDTPGPLYNTARVDVNLFIFDPEAGYRVYEGKGGSFDVLGGIRLWSVENSLETTTGIAPGFNVSERKTWVAFVGGFHGVANVTPKFFLSTKFDIGAGSGTDITTQFYGGAGFRIKPNAALIGGYRFLKVDHDDSSGFIFNTNMNGFVIGGKFNF